MSDAEALALVREQAGNFREQTGAWCQDEAMSRFLVAAMDKVIAYADAGEYKMALGANEALRAGVLAAGPGIFAR